jgi:hypothetical protein
VSPSACARLAIYDQTELARCLNRGLDALEDAVGVSRDIPTNPVAVGRVGKQGRRQQEKHCPIDSQQVMPRGFEPTLLVTQDPQRS